MTVKLGDEDLLSLGVHEERKLRMTVLGFKLLTYLK